jgi:RHS repeat-associated protein
MRVKRVSRAWLLCGAAAVSIVAGLGGASASRAQTAPAAPAPTAFPTLDESGVDLSSGRFTLSRLEAAVGTPGEGGLSRMDLGLGLRDNVAGTFDVDQDELDNDIYTVSIGGVAARFSGYWRGPFVPMAGAEGHTLTYDAAARSYTHVGRDGTVSTFSEELTSASGLQGGLGLLVKMVRPDGEQLTYAYDQFDTACGKSCSRLIGVTSSLGYVLKYEYQGTNNEHSLKLARVTAVNLATEYCDPAAAACASGSWTSTAYSGPATYGAGEKVATDSLGRQTTYTYDAGGRLTRLVQGGTGRSIEIQYYDAAGRYRVKSVTTPAGTWSYSWTEIRNTTTGYKDLRATVTNPAGEQRVVLTNGRWGRPVSETLDPVGLNRTTTSRLDANGRVDQVTYPEGNKVAYGYDVRGNVTSVTEIGKDGTSVTRATFGYDATCANPKTCNQPNWQVVGGARTDFAYEAHGGVKTIVGPADANGVRAQVDNVYTPLRARYLTAPGVLGDSPAPIYRLTQTSACTVGVGCAGGENQVVTSFARGGAAANNLQVSQVTVRDGRSNGVSATTAFTYNRYGDVRTIDGPLPGDDTTRFRYDAMRQLVGTVGVDPDGQGAGIRAAATRYGYTPDGALGWVQAGTVASQSDQDWLNFQPAYAQAYVRDAAGRITQVRQTVQGEPKTLTQYSYAGNRLQCSTVRMNPAAFSGLPADACTPSSEGAHGADRITRLAYTAAGEVRSVIEAAGRPEQREMVLTYTPNGRLSTARDGKQQLTTLEYDRFDRPWRTRFPAQADPTTSSTSDYTEVLYDEATGLASGQRRRDGSWTSLRRDPRGRIVAIDAPIATTFEYDNLDRVVTASAGGETVQRRYDALGRLTAQGGPAGWVLRGYDAAGRPEWLQHPDGFNVAYEHNLAGQLTRLSESYRGGPLLAQFTYDELGRRRTMTRGDGSSTSYGYDEISRLKTLTLDLPGSSGDLQRTFAYNAANEIVERTNSNAAYGLEDRAAGVQVEVDGRNRVTSVDGRPATNDGRGNLTSDGVTAYGYDEANRLTRAGDTQMTYDPLSRVRRIDAGGVVSNLVYDGLDIAVEYWPDGSVRRRYVHGPGQDEPLVLYENGQKRWLSADERGSVVAYSDTTGLLVQNRYDEYGVPGANNQGRFQFTGQVRVPLTGLYHYKGRAYAPSLGRFLQPDPIGYAAGPNLYAYVQGDPVNRIDPLGLNEIEGVTVTPMPGGGGFSGGSPAPVGLSGYEPDFRRGAARCDYVGSCVSFHSDEIVVTGRRLSRRGVGSGLDLVTFSGSAGGIGSAGGVGGSENSGGRCPAGIGGQKQWDAGGKIYGVMGDSSIAVAARTYGPEAVGAGGRAFGLIGLGFSATAEIVGYNNSVAAGMAEGDAAVYHGTRLAYSTTGAMAGAQLGFALGWAGGPLGAAIGAGVGGLAGGIFMESIGDATARELIGCN